MCVHELALLSKSALHILIPSRRGWNGPSLREEAPNVVKNRVGISLVYFITMLLGGPIELNAHPK